MRSFFIFVVLFFSLNLNASEKAITEDGDIVILHPNGTWWYEDNNDTNSDIPYNRQTFNKAKKASFIVKSTKNKSAYAIDPKVWLFTRNESGSVGDNEYLFQAKGIDLYGMAITEAVEIGLEYLGDIALQNAREAAPDARIVDREYRTVNGEKVLYMEMRGTLSGIDFTYLGYYHSNEAGSTQLVAYTGTKLVPKFKSKITQFLNGLIIQ